jgi:membrane fusion protein (multidrug efflux system)
MHLGDKNNRPLSTRRRRLAKVLIGIAVLVVIVSAGLRLAYHEIPGLVMGREFEISSVADGTVAHIHKRANETYRKGEALVTVESQDLLAQLAAVEHDLEEVGRSLASEHSKEGLERRRFELQAAIASSESELRSCRVEMESIERVLPGLQEWRDLAAGRLKRGEELRAQEALTIAELEDRRRNLVDAQDKLEEAKAKQGVLESQKRKIEELLSLHRARFKNLVAERTSFITELELMRQEKEGERDRLQALLADLHLVADHDGMVTEVLRQEGEYVASGGPILRVMRDEDVWVEAYLPVSEKRFIKRGDRVEVRGKMPLGSLSGQVSNVLPVLKPLPVFYQSRLGRQENYVVLVITMDDGALARGVLSPAQQVTARIRRSIVPGDPEANAEGRE